MLESLIRRTISSFVEPSSGRAPRRRSSSDPEPLWTFTASSGAAVKVFDSSRRNGRGEVVWEILAPGGMDARAYRKNPIVLDGHRLQGSEFVLGTASVQVAGGLVEAAVHFDVSPGAAGRRVARLVGKGMLRGCSLGYLVGESRELGHHDDGLPLVERTAWELVEVSIVALPADPDALARSWAEARGIPYRALKPAKVPKPPRRAKRQAKKRPQVSPLEARDAGALAHLLRGGA